MDFASEGLSLNVIVPTGTKAGANLPVAVVSSPVQIHMSLAFILTSCAVDLRR